MLVQPILSSDTPDSPHTTRTPPATHRPRVLCILKFRPVRQGKRLLNAGGLIGEPEALDVRMSERFDERAGQLAAIEALNKATRKTDQRLLLEQQKGKMLSGCVEKAHANLLMSGAKPGSDTVERPRRRKAGPPLKQYGGMAFGADMSKEDEVAMASLAAAKATEELLAAEEAAERAAATKEPSKRQKQKHKRKAKQEQKQHQAEETSVAPSLAMISRVEQEAMLAESIALSAHYAEIDRQAASVSRDVDSEVEFVDDEEGPTFSEVEISDATDEDRTKEGTALSHASEPTAVAAAAAVAAPRHHDDSSDDTALLSRDDEAWRQTAQQVVRLDSRENNDSHEDLSIDRVLPCC